jgi:hypothetical protein
VKRLQLPENFFDYLNAPDCSGCIGCKSDEFNYESTETSLKSKKFPINRQKSKLDRSHEDKASTNTSRSSCPMKKTK